jgi:hypothetical protein
MSAEAFHSAERSPAQEELIRGVEVAARAIVRIRLLIEEHRGRLDLERAEKIVNLEIIKHLTDTIKELEGELEDALVFLEEFDPILFQKLKDNS